MLACVKSGTVQKDFKVFKKQGVDTLGTETCLISSIYKSSRMTCIGSCNSNPQCQTVVFDESKVLKINCFMYNRYFKSGE